MRLNKNNNKIIMTVIVVSAIIHLVVYYGFKNDEAFFLMVSFAGISFLLTKWVLAKLEKRHN